MRPPLAAAHPTLLVSPGLALTPVPAACAPSLASRPGPAPSKGGSLVTIRTRKEIERAFQLFPDLFPPGWDADDVSGFMNQARLRAARRMNEWGRRSPAPPPRRKRAWNCDP